MNSTRFAVECTTPGEKGYEVVGDCPRLKDAHALAEQLRHVFQGTPWVVSGIVQWEITPAVVVVRFQ